MNKHSFNVLEFDKLKELILENIVIDDNREVIENLEPYKDLNSILINKKIIHRNFTISIVK